VKPKEVVLFFLGTAFIVYVASFLIQDPPKPMPLQYATPVTFPTPAVRPVPAPTTSTAFAPILPKARFHQWHCWEYDFLSPHGCPTPSEREFPEGFIQRNN
jgi:hypothetical protein